MDDIKIPVPWDDQWGLGANAYKDDCFYAGLMMALQYHQIAAGLTIDMLSSLIPPIFGLSCENGAKVSIIRGLDARVETLTPQSIYDHLAAKRIVIPLVESTAFAEFQDKGVFEHFLVITGHTANGDFYANDPNRLYGNTYGVGIILPVEAMVNGLAKAIDSNGKTSQGVIIYGRHDMTARTAAMVNNPFGLNVRVGPSTSSAIITELPDKSPIWLIEGNPISQGVYSFGFANIPGGAYGWVNLPFTTTDTSTPTPAALDAYTNSGGLRLRAAPNTSAAIKRVMDIHTPLTITAKGLVWDAVTVGTDSGWAATQFITQGTYVPPQPAPTPPSPVVGTAQNFVGWFCFPDTPPSFFDMLARLAKAGRAVPIVTVLQDHGMADRIKTISPQTIVIFRYEDGNPGPNDSAQGWFDRLWPYLSQSSLADYYEFANEGMEDGAAFVKFYNDLMDIAAQHHIHITVADLAMGNGITAEVQQLLGRIASEHHVLNYHQYSQNSAAGDASMYPDVNDLELRWLPWLIGTVGVFVAGGECGTGNANFMGVDQTIALMKQFNAIMLRYAKFILGGGAWWCLGGHGGFGWDRSSCDAALGAYEAMVIAA